MKNLKRSVITTLALPFFLVGVGFVPCNAQDTKTIPPKAAPATTSAENDFDKDKKPRPTFMNIPWGTSQATVKKVLVEKGFSPVSIKPERMVTGSGKFGGYTVESISLLFATDRLCKAVVYFDKPSEHRLLEQYKDIKALIVTRFGKPKNDFYFFSSPYEAGDGHEITALSVGKGTVMAYWEFTEKNDKDGKEPPNKSSVMVKASDDLQILVSYEDDKLMEKYVVNKEKKAASDF